MAINLKTKCEECIHNSVCRNAGNAKHMVDKLNNTNYGDGPNDDYDWDIMSDHYHVNIDVYCNDFKKSEPIPRASGFSKHDRPYERS